MRDLRLVTLVLLLVLAPVAGGPALAATCESLSKIALPGTTILGARSEPAGPVVIPTLPPTPAVPAFCRVSGTIKPSADSDIQFEVWLPASGWNGKFRGVGNGGFAGAISYDALAGAVKEGFAAASTDTGHQAAGIDASWALGHPEKVVDFGYRAIHEMTVAGKAITAAFYDTPARRSYFHACSNGGRQALMEAQRFPADYDGIVAGAPANHWTHLLAQAVWDLQATTSNPASYIPASKVPAIEAATLAQCDAADGVKDGVVDDPSRCPFRPATLLCKGAESDGCLTASQVAALDKLFAGPRTAAGLIHPGHVPGGATGPGSWSLWITGPAAGKSLIAQFGTQFFRNMVFEDESWDFRRFELERDTKRADDKLARILNATDPDLGPFRRRGGRLIVYHGWSDPAISPLSAIAYDQSVRAKMGGASADEVIRLFMVPGMQHCGGGPGPSDFAGPDALQRDALHDVDAAVAHWVEDGVAPAEIIAAKRDAAGGVVRTRPLCPYPKVARYKGTGSTDDAASFSCANPTPSAPGR